MQQRAVFTAVVGAVMGFCLAGTVLGQEPPPRVTLAEAMSLFAQHSLHLRIARSEAREAMGLARQAAAYPNPSVSLTHEALGGGAADYSETYYNLNQRIDWPWLARARQTAASRFAEAAGARLAADSAGLAFEVKRAFIEAAAAERARDALESATALVSFAEEHAVARAASGDLSEYELQRLRIERTRYEIDLAAATLALSTARRSLTLLVLPDAVGEQVPIGLPDGVPIEVSLDDALGAARISRPELVAAARRAEAALSVRQAAGAERLPPPTLTAGYKDQSDGLSGVFLGLGLPLPLFDRKRAAVAAGTAAVSAAESRHVLVARQIDSDVHAVHDAYRAARANLTRAGRFGPTDTLLEVARIAYEEGEMTLVELFDAVDAFRVAHVIATRAIADLWVSFYDLERAVGAPLDALPTEEVH